MGGPHSPTRSSLRWGLPAPRSFDGPLHKPNEWFFNQTLPLEIAAEQLEFACYVAQSYWVERDLHAVNDGALAAPLKQGDGSTRPFHAKAAQAQVHRIVAVTAAGAGASVSPLVGPVASSFSGRPLVVPSSPPPSSSSSIATSSSPPFTSATPPDVGLSSAPKAAPFVIEPYEEDDDAMPTAPCSQEKEEEKSEVRPSPPREAPAGDVPGQALPGRTLESPCARGSNQVAENDTIISDCGPGDVPDKETAIPEKWSHLRLHGWTWCRGRSLENWCYLRPGLRPKEVRSKIMFVFHEMLLYSDVFVVFLSLFALDF